MSTVYNDYQEVLASIPKTHTHLIPSIRVDIAIWVEDDLKNIEISLIEKPSNLLFTDRYYYVIKWINLGTSEKLKWVCSKVYLDAAKQLCIDF